MQPVAHFDLECGSLLPPLHLETLSVRRRKSKLVHFEKPAVFEAGNNQPRALPLRSRKKRRDMRSQKSGARSQNGFYHGFPLTSSTRNMTESV
jgi:hypothetical protein